MKNLKTNSKINVDDCVRIFPRRKYATLEVDLWNNRGIAFDFTPVGAERVYQLMRGYLFGSRNTKAVLVGSPESRSCMFLSNITVSEAEHAAAVVKNIIKAIDATTQIR